MLITGDFYQLKPVLGSALYERPRQDDVRGKKGVQIWMDYLNEYVELTENCRFSSTELPILQTFLTNVRVGKVDEDLLLQMNSRLVGLATAKRKADPRAVWIAATNNQVNKFNRDDFNTAIENGKRAVRCVAMHTSARPMIANPTADTRQKLLQIYNKAQKDYMPHLDLYIGQQVVVTENLATSIGKQANIEIIFQTLNGLLYCILLQIIRNI